MALFEDFLSPILHSANYSVLPLAGDASTRRYYRIVTESKAWVLMEWEPFENPSNFPFLSVQEYFDKNNIRVPKVFHFDNTQGLFLLEDLGDLTLERRFWEFQNQDSILMDELVANELEVNEPRENFKGKTLEELQILLDEAVANEDYEKAAHIRDEISKRE